MRTFFSVILFLFSVASYSQEKEILLVRMNDGTTLNFSLSEKPLLTFDAESVVISGQEATASLARADVAGVYFVSAAQTGIGAAVTPDAPTLNGDSFSVTGLERGAVVKVYSVKGENVLSVMADASGTAVASLAALEQGVYVIEYCGVTFKMMKR